LAARLSWTKAIMNFDINVLLVDDDTAITELLGPYLARFGFRAFPAANGDEMKQCLQRERIDVVVLDLMLPGLDGLALAQALRSRSRIPIVILSARCDLANRVVGLEVGADDFLAKPFNPRELAARLRAVLRRGATYNTRARGEGSLVHFSGWTLDRDERRLQSPRGVAIHLSNAEYQLLQAFLRAPQRVVSREQLMEQVGGRARSNAQRSIDQLVSSLRQKLGVGGAIEPLIRTVHGEGYRFDARPESRAAA
jgi:two-component system OmpR family response regulator